MTIFEIDAQMQSVMDNAIDPETGEINADVFEQLETLQMERTEKIANAARYVVDLKAESDALKKTVKGLADRASQAEKKAESLKRYLDYALDGEKYKDETVSVLFRRSKSVNILDESVLPDDFTIIERKPSKTAIKAAIEAGTDVPGAEIVENRSVIVK